MESFTMIEFYYSGAPNPMKVALLLEETATEYQAIPVDTRAGDQHKPEFEVINPNRKVPVIIDSGKVVFDSNAILLYLAEKTDSFLPPNELRGETLSWLMFVASGIGPYSGQAVHFQHHAPAQDAYAINRYRFEVERHYGIVDARLADQSHMVGDAYSIVDMALWGWARMLPLVLGEESMATWPNLSRLMSEINSRPAAARATTLKDRHNFKTEMDDEARRNMFPGNARL